MYYSSGADTALYSKSMEEMKKINADWIQIRKSRQYRVGMVLCELVDDIKRLDFKTMRKSVKRWTDARRKMGNPALHFQQNNAEANYFSEDKVAIYTAIYGSYDNLLEPYCTPDNCDYFVFSDSVMPQKGSSWKYRETPGKLDGWTDMEKNRYLKMRPHELFPDYRYSIYVDGNIQIITDLTEYVNLLGSSGLGTHLHESRNCVYDEMDKVAAVGKETKECINRHRAYMQSTGMPIGYGLLQCSVIVREHHNPVCLSLMNEWWKEFSEYSRRDQISLPHVLYRKKISVEEVGIMGNNIKLNPAFRVVVHR